MPIKRMEETVENSTLTKLNLTSDAFQNGQPIPTQYTCDGADQTPRCTGPTAGRHQELRAGHRRPRRAERHIPPLGRVRHSRFGAVDRRRTTGRHGGDNDFGKSGYGGPCPPKGHGPHHYHFKLFALDVDRLGLAREDRDVESASSTPRQAS